MKQFAFGLFCAVIMLLTGCIYLPSQPNNKKEQMPQEDKLRYNDYRYQNPYNFQTNPYEDRYVRPYNFRAEMLRLHNDERTYNRIAPLQEDYQLNRIAQEHTDFMAYYNRLSHYGYNNSRPWDRVTKEMSVTAVGENIAMNGESEQGVFERWIKSDGHRRNIMADFKRVGFGKSITRDGNIYWCVLFTK